MDDLLTELERQLCHSSFFTQASLEKHGKLADKLDTYVTALIDLLVQGGVIAVDDLRVAVDENRRAQAEATRDRYDREGTLPPWPNVVVREDDGATPAPEVEIDCAARIDVCHAVCCTLPFPLSAAEVEAGKVKWDLGHPYVIRHDSHGRCVHNDPAAGTCGVYHDRPAVCRGYSCAHDERIWKDFDNMVLNEEYLGSRARSDYTFRPASAAAVPVTVTSPRRLAATMPGVTADCDPPIDLPVAG